MKRRTVLGLAGGAVSTTLLGSIAAAPQGAAQAASGKAAAFDPADPVQLALAFRKLAHSLDDSLTWWWLHGTRYDRKGGTPFANFRMPGMKIGRQESDFGPAWVQDDEVMVRGDFMLHAEPEDPSRPTFTAVVDPRVKNPTCAQDFNDILDFPAWLQMPGHPGTYYSRCFGRKVFRYEQMPGQWRTLFEGRFPQEAKDPGGLLA
jgi:hypothetical protein